MTDPLTPVRLATIRNNHARDLRLGEEHLLLADSSDLGDLLGEVDRLTAELDEARKHARTAVAQSVRLATALADARQELADAACELGEQRGHTARAEALLDTITAERNDARAVAGRLLADIELWVGFSAVRSLDLAVLPSWCLDWAHAVGPHRAPQPPAEPPTARECAVSHSSDDQASEAL